jgi:hypothetical protein
MIQLVPEHRICIAQASRAIHGSGHQSDIIDDGSRIPPASGNMITAGHGMPPSGYSALLDRFPPRS